MAGISSIAKVAGVKEEQVKAVFHAISLMAAEERVTVKGFGSFQIKQKAAREGRNPKTGETIRIPEKLVLKFSAAKV